MIRSLLALVCVVHDDADVLADTLASARAHVDQWMIVDRARDPEIARIAKEVMGDLPGAVVRDPEEPPLDPLVGHAAYVVTLEPDEALVGGEALRAALVGERGRNREFRFQYRVRVEGTIDVREARVFRMGSLRVGEWLARERDLRHVVELDGAFSIAHARGPVGAARAHKRRKRDLMLLEAWVRSHPDDGEALARLGATYEELGFYDLATAAFERRARLGSGSDRFEARLHQARIAIAADERWADCLDQLLVAHEEDPTQPAPLLLAARHYDREASPARALLFARHALALHRRADDRLTREEASELEAIVARSERAMGCDTNSSLS